MANTSILKEQQLQAGNASQVMTREARKKVLMSPPFRRQRMHPTNKLPLF